MANISFICFKSISQITLILVCSLITFPFLATYGQGYNWAIRDGGSNYEAGKFIGVDGSGNSYVLGVFEGTTVIGSSSFTSYGQEDVFLAKYNNSGVLLWVLQIGAIGPDDAAGIAVDNSGNCYASVLWDPLSTPGGVINIGSSIIAPIHNAFGHDCILIKFNPSGLIEWWDNADSPQNVEFGRVALNPNGDILYWCVYSKNDQKIFGQQDNVRQPFDTVPYPSGYGFTGYSLIKLDQNGNIDWVRYNMTPYISVTSPKEFGPGSISSDAGNNCIITDSYLNYIDAKDNTGGTIASISCSVNTNGFVQKYSSTGNMQFLLGIGSATTLARATGVACDNSGDSYILGWFKDACTFGSTILTGTDGYNSTAIFIAKVDPFGVWKWAQKITSDGPFDTYSVASDGTNIYCAGYNNSGNMFFGTALKPVVIHNSEGNIWLAKYTSSGSYKWSSQAGKGSSFLGNHLYGLVCYKNSKLKLTGDFDGLSSNNFGSYILTSAGNADIFLGEFKNCNSGFAPTISPAGTTSVSCGGSVTYSAPFLLGYNYEWYFENNIITGATSFSHSVTSATSDDDGKYYVLVNNGNACNITTPKATLKVVGACKEDESYSMKYETDLISTSPNDQLTFLIRCNDSENNADARVDLINLYGESVYHLSQPPFNSEITTNNYFKDGIYLLRLQMQNQFKFVKVIIAHN